MSGGAGDGGGSDGGSAMAGGGRGKTHWTGEGEMARLVVVLVKALEGLAHISLKRAVGHQRDAWRA